MNELIIQAERNFKVVSRLWSEIDEYWGMQAVMYHLQQAIEQTLKALVMLGGNELPKTHQVRELIRLCPEYIVLPTELEDLADTLTLWNEEAIYNPNALSNINTVTKCRQIYIDLHDIAISAMRGGSL